VCEAFFSYVERRVFPGGCLFVATALEMGAHPGPVRDRVVCLVVQPRGVLDPDLESRAEDRLGFGERREEW